MGITVNMACEFVIIYMTQGICEIACRRIAIKRLRLNPKEKSVVHIEMKGAIKMYINPFLAGVVATIFAESIALIVWGILINRRR